MQGKKPTAGLTYAAAGVDIEAADSAKRRIKALARSTFNAAVVGDIGSFGGLFRPDLQGFEKPLLVSSADGVGTKLKIAFMTGVHHTVGLDLVNHCVDDILAQGALPLFFMDYIACGRLEAEVVERIVSGLALGCRQSECVLLGGETAEMPDFYAPGEYDLAGFIVGLVDQEKVLGADRVRVGDVLLGLPSSGLHTNGYSLARKLFFELEGLSPDSRVPELGRTVGEELLTPHRSYLPALKDSLDPERLHALAHVTGGGIPGNLSRVLQPGQDAAIRLGSWEVPAVFRFIQERGRVETAEMFRTFNMGVGMIAVAAPDFADSIKAAVEGSGMECRFLGEIVPGRGSVRLS